MATATKAAKPARKHSNLPWREQELVDAGAPRVHAFWGHDLFPYLLQGVGYLADKGNVYVPSYRGFYKPIFVLGLKEGAALAEELQNLSLRHRYATQELLRASRAERTKILEKYGQEIKG